MDLKEKIKFNTEAWTLTTTIIIISQNKDSFYKNYNIKTPNKEIIRIIIILHLNNNKNSWLKEQIIITLLHKLRSWIIKKP